MHKTPEQKKIIRETLEGGRIACGRTVYDAVEWAGCGQTRTLYYRGLDGELSDEYQICFFMSCLCSASLFDKYCKACSIYLSDESEYGEFGIIVRTYIFEHDGHYDVFELNDILISTGQPPLLKQKAA